jgi:choline-glycine betaine transporter
MEKEKVVFVLVLIIVASVIVMNMLIEEDHDDHPTIFEMFISKILGWTIVAFSTTMKVP